MESERWRKKRRKWKERGKKKRRRVGDGKGEQKKEERKLNKGKRKQGRERQGKKMLNDMQTGWDERGGKGEDEVMYVSASAVTASASCSLLLDSH